MSQVNMLEAKTKLSKLVEAIETGRETEVILARNGKPVARIVALAEPVVDTSKRLGIAEGLFGDLDEQWFQDFQALDEVVWKGFWENPAKFPQPAKPRSRKSSK
jgi:antitoxin (DNA-binding transcriptional repressor) of toxin-antitoxin stability system